MTMTMTMKPYSKVTIHHVNAYPEQTARPLAEAWGWIHAAGDALEEIESELYALYAQEQKLNTRRDKASQEYKAALSSPGQDWRTRKLLRDSYYDAVIACSAASIKYAEKNREHVYACSGLDDAHRGLIASIEQILLHDGRLPEHATNVTIHYTHPQANIVASWGGKQFSISPDGIVHVKVCAK